MLLRAGAVKQEQNSLGVTFLVFKFLSIIGSNLYCLQHW